MKATLFAVLAVTSSAVAELEVRQGCQVDSCASAVNSVVNRYGGIICNSFISATVPAATRTRGFSIPGLPTLSFERRQERRQFDFNNLVPSFINGCSGDINFASACLCFGITTTSAGTDPSTGPTGTGGTGPNPTGPSVTVFPTGTSPGTGPSSPAGPSGPFTNTTIPGTGPTTIPGSDPTTIPDSGPTTTIPGTGITTLPAGTDASTGGFPTPFNGFPSFPFFEPRPPRADPVRRSGQIAAEDYV